MASLYMFYPILLIVAIAVIFAFLTIQSTKESFENDQCVNVDYSVKVVNSKASVIGWVESLGS